MKCISHIVLYKILFLYNKDYIKWLICNNELICYWAGTAAFRRFIIPFYIDLILCIMILYKNYIRILDGVHSYSFVNVDVTIE